jgi:hypothetical protein
MGVAATTEYENAIRKLFPQGEYWDRQFSDPESDVSLFCKAKLPELIKFRRRMETLQNESYVETTEELITDWERVLLNSVYPSLSLIQRRLQLKKMWTVRLNRAELQKVADIFELTIADVFFPYRSGFFGFSRFGNSYIGSPLVFSVLFFTIQQENFREKSWALIKPDYPTKKFGRMRFGLDRLVYFPIYQLRLYVWAKLRESCTGFAKCGVNRMFPLVPGFNVEEFTGSIRFFYHFENALIKYMIKEKQPFKEFELAISSILLANQLPYFSYKDYDHDD